MEELEQIQTHALFSKEAQFSFLCVAVMKVLLVASSAIYQGASNYDKLKRTVKDYGNKPSALNLCQPHGEKDTSELLRKRNCKDLKILVRSDSCVQNMEYKINMLTKQIFNLSFIMKRGQSWLGQMREVSGQAFEYGNKKSHSYCRKPGHSANRCKNNPSRHNKCRNYSRTGHRQERCWSERKQLSFC